MSDINDKINDKTTGKCYFIFVWSFETTGITEDMDLQDHSLLLVKVWIGATTLDNSLVLSFEFEHSCILWSSNVIPWYICKRETVDIYDWGHIEEIP